MTTESNSMAESTACSITVLFPHPRLPPVRDRAISHRPKDQTWEDILSSILFESEDPVDALASRSARVTEDSRTTVVGVSRANYGRDGGCVSLASVKPWMDATYLFLDVGRKTESRDQLPSLLREPSRPSDVLCVREVLYLK